MPVPRKRPRLTEREDWKEGRARLNSMLGHVSEREREAALDRITARGWGRTPEETAAARDRLNASAGRAMPRRKPEDRWGLGMMEEFSSPPRGEQPLNPWSSARPRLKTRPVIPNWMRQTEAMNYPESGTAEPPMEFSESVVGPFKGEIPPFNARQPLQGIRGVIGAIRSMVDPSETMWMEDPETGKYEQVTITVGDKVDELPDDGVLLDDVLSELRGSSGGPIRAMDRPMERPMAAVDRNMEGMRAIPPMAMRNSMVENVPSGPMPRLSPGASGGGGQVQSRPLPQIPGFPQAPPAAAQPPMQGGGNIAAEAAKMGMSPADYLNYLQLQKLGGTPAQAGAHNRLMMR